MLSNIKYTPSPYGASSIDDILDKDGSALPANINTPNGGVLNISGRGMWEFNDKNNYTYHTHYNKGQICDDEFSKDIESYARNSNFKTFLEVGTWNGLGSTKAFANGFKNRKDDYIFYSLECNKDKCADAMLLYKNNKNINILNEVIWNKEPDNFYEIFPQCLSNELFKHWNEVDIVNMKQCNIFLDRDSLPHVFDVLLLDGGEFTTYYEFQLLKNRCKILMLDDINTDKCKLIVQEINSDPSWKIIKTVNVRNGYLIAEKSTGLPVKI